MSAYQPANFSRFGDVAVRLSVELGRTDMPLREVLMLGEGSTVALDRLTDELLDVTANGRVIARGEVVADKGRFALRIVSLVGEDGQDMPPPPSAPPPNTAPADPAVSADDAV
jgi:flagellar motor switch protein FliN